MCHPILKYAAEIWEGQISGEWSKRLERVQYLFGFLRLAFSVEALCLWCSFRAWRSASATCRVQLKLGFWRRVCCANPTWQASVCGFQEQIKFCLQWWRPAQSLGFLQGPFRGMWSRLLEECGLGSAWSSLDEAKRESWHSTYSARVLCINKSSYSLLLFLAYGSINPFAGY